MKILCVFSMLFLGRWRVIAIQDSPTGIITTILTSLHLQVLPTLSFCLLSVSQCMWRGRHVSRPRRDFWIIQRIWNSSPCQRQLCHWSGPYHIHNRLTALTHTHTNTQLVHITSSAVIFPHEEKAFLYLFTSTESDVIVSIASITVSVG